MNRHSALCLTLVIAAIPTTAFAGNDDEILIGTQGARLGGAVTATVTDSTALWYNPGAIGRTRWAQFGVTGTLDQARFHNAVLPTGVDPGDADATELSVVPSTLGHELPLPNNWAFGYGVFTSQAQSRVLALESDTSSRTEASFRRHTYNFGAGLGAPLGSTLRVGLGVFAAYEDLTRAGFSNAAPEVWALSNHRRALSSFASLGLHWAPTPSWNMGLSVISPRMLLVSDVNQDGTSLDPGFAASAPMRVRAGIAHDFGRVVISVDGDVQPALENDDALVDRRLVPNGRLGFDYQLDDQTQLGLGLFTDLGPERASNARIDFFGVSGGIETATRYALAADESAESIEISAFIGFRYAYGDGQGIDTHEIGINLGSGLRF